MFITITIKAQAESKEEAANTFGGDIKVIRAHFDKLLEQGVFGPPQQVQLRYLISGELAQPVQEPDQPVVQQSVTPRKAKKPVKPDVE